MSDMVVGQPGWALTGNATRFHYFPDDTGHSLCRQWFKFSPGTFLTVPEPKKCKACQAKLAKQKGA